MKKVLVISALVLAPLALVGSSGLSSACVDGTMDSGNCYPGHVRFSGTGYPPNIHVAVKKTDGPDKVYDDFDYDAGSGVDFTEVLYPAGRYEINITSSNGYSETKTVYTGSYTRD